MSTTCKRRKAAGGTDGVIKRVFDGQLGLPSKWVAPQAGAHRPQQQQRCGRGGHDCKRRRCKRRRRRRRVETVECAAPPCVAACRFGRRGWEERQGVRTAGAVGGAGQARSCPGKWRGRSHLYPSSPLAGLPKAVHLLRASLQLRNARPLARACRGAPWKGGIRNHLPSTVANECTKRRIDSAVDAALVECMHSQ